MHTLTIMLSDEAAKIVADRVEAGDFLSESHMIEDALSLLDDRAREKQRRLASLRAKLDAGINDPMTLTADEVRARLEAHIAMRRRA